MLPKARLNQILVEQVDDELVVYDEARDVAHSLNPSAALVWRHCDGRTTVPELTNLLHTTLKLPADEELVWLALDRLETAHLLQDRLERPTEMASVSRRQVIRKLGLASGVALLLPVVTSIVAPSPALAASGPPGPPPPPPLQQACSCPTCQDALKNKTVSDAVDAAWTASQPGDKDKRHEEGGWVIMSTDNTTTPPCALRVQGVAVGERAGLNPGADPSKAGEKACGFFHTHPNPAKDEKGREWVQGPSDADKAWHTARKLWGIVRNAAGNTC